jgi:DNA processing protein
MRKLEKHEIPNQLFEIPEPPKVLWVEGTMPPDDTVYLTVVGSRNHTNYGRDVCMEIIKGLAGYPITIVSGLALGIDSIAHRTAIKYGLHTVSFPGSGIGNEALYPRTNWSLANEIVDAGGALVSEFDPDAKSEIWMFPRRNRLMAGLSHGVLIIEAEEKSGTLITARLAMDYNRDVFVIPGSIFSENSLGTNRLIRDGAYPITSAVELLQALGFDPEQDTRANQDSLFDSTLSTEEKHIIELLHPGPLPKDMLVKLAGMEIQKINILLSQMELNDLIIEEGGMLRKK